MSEEELKINEFDEHDEVDAEIDGMEAHFVHPLAQLCQAKALTACRKEHVPYESSTASFPIPSGDSDNSEVKVLIFRCNNDPVQGDYYYFEPEWLYTVNTKSLEITSEEQLKEVSPEEREQLEPICYRFPHAAQNAYFEYRDCLYQELLVSYDRLTNLSGRNDLSDDDREFLKRFDHLFRFLVNAELFPFYENASPEFFSWLSSQTGIIERTQIDTMPAPNFDYPPSPRIAPEFHEAVAIDSLTPEVGPPWRASTTELLYVLNECGLTPNERSPLHGLTSDGEFDGQVFMDFLPENEAEEWKSVLKTLCEPRTEIIQSFTDEIGHYTTNVFIGDERNEQGEALWVRYTIDETTQEHVIGFPLYPERMKETVLEGIMARHAKSAQQIIHSFSMDEISVIFALADIISMTEAKVMQVSQKALVDIWDDKDTSQRTYWTDAGRFTSPVPLKKIPEDHMKDGLEKLAAENMLVVDGDTITIGREIRALLRTLEPPRAFGTLYIRNVEDDGSLSFEGFSIIRTESKIWLWEHKEDYHTDDASGDTEVNFFQITGQQLGILFDDYLNIQQQEPARV